MKLKNETFFPPRITNHIVSGHTIATIHYQTIIKVR